VGAVGGQRHIADIQAGVWHHVTVLIDDDRSATITLTRFGSKVPLASVAFREPPGDRRDRIVRGVPLQDPEPALPEPPQSCRMWTDEEIEADSRRIIENPARLDRLNAF
jgi:hypothetical protein